MALTVFDPSAAALRNRRRALALSFVGLAVFLAWEAVSLSHFIKNESRPPAWDQSIHMEIALDYSQAVKAGDLGAVWRLAPKPGMPPFPPLYHLLLMRAYSDPDPAGAALWINWFYLAILSFSLFAIVWEFRADETALAATIVFVCSPIVQELYTTQLIDLAVVALAAASYWVLLRSEAFTKWVPSLAFGALFALGMMHKWSFFSYMLPAYYLALVALGLRASRWQAASAAALACAGCLPWYLSHLPLLLPRLLQASSDFAVPFWQGGAFFTYFLQSADGLGPLFWALAWIALLVPQYRRNWHKGWLIPAWVLASYVFWAIVPNRQLRFLLPGLPGLSVALCGAWPPSVVWGLAAVQLFTAANFTGGWISAIRIPLPFHTFELLPTAPPAKEDWKIEEILREAKRRHEPSVAFGNLTLVANSPRFNGPNFTWMVRRLNIPEIRIRGANKRLCEFSEFVVLKTGSLGPEAVIGGLPEAAKVIRDPKGWFPRAYEEAVRWPLPDKSEAVLYQRRRPDKPPFRDKSLVLNFFNTGHFTGTNLKITFGPWDKVGSSYEWVRVTADEVVLRGLKAQGVAVRLERALFVPASEEVGSAGWDDVRFLFLGRLKVESLRVAGVDLASFIEDRVKGLEVRELQLEKGGVSLTGSLRHLSVAARLDLRVDQAAKRLRIEAREASVGVSPVPAWLLGPWKSVAVPLDPSPETPFWIDLPGLTLSGGRLSVP